MSSNGEDLTARITKMIADATQQEWDALTDSAWADYCGWLAEQRSAAADDLTAQLAKVMYEADAEYMNAVQGWSLMGWDRASELNRKTSAIAATAALAHLQSIGRLIPAGGMALTAEEVEDVEALVATANPYSAPAARLRALFPATEPAEEVKPVKFRKMTAKYATANFGFPDVTDPFTRWAYKDSDGDKWAWNGDQWELHIVPPSPAEPAEEETKAEVWDAGFEAGYDHAGCEHTPSGISIDPPLNPYDERTAPASSPVVPAPTETGPWQRIEDVPEGVGRLTDRDGDVWEWDGDDWVTPETAILPTAYINKHYAPFVAAEEG